MAPIIGHPVKVKMGTAIIAVDYDLFKKLVRSVKEFVFQNVFMNGQELIIEYSGANNKGRIALVTPPAYDELDGLPIIEL